MAHHTHSTDHKDKTREESESYISSSRSQSQQPASQTLRYFVATAEPAAPYISPYPPTTASIPNSREASSIQESALPLSTSTFSSSPQASSIPSSAGSTSRIMSTSRTISAVCEISAHPSYLPSSIIFMTCEMHILCLYAWSFSISPSSFVFLSTLPAAAPSSYLSLLNFVFRTRKLSWSVLSKHTRSIPSPSFVESRKFLLLPMQPTPPSQWPMHGLTTSTRTTCSASFAHWPRIILSAPSVWMRPNGRWSATPRALVAGIIAGWCLQKSVKSESVHPF